MHAAQRPPAIPVPRSGNGRSRFLGAAAIAAAVLAAGCGAMPASIAESGSNPVTGFAGTVVRYADRDYEGAAWQQWHAAANLGTLPVVGVRAAELQRILGVDEDNLWIADAKGIVFRLADGHWEVAANQPDAANPLVSVIGDDTLLMSGYRSRRRVYLVGPEGVRTVTYDGLQVLRPTDAVTPIAPDLAYVHGYRQTYKLLEQNLTRVSPGTAKDSLVVDESGAPVMVRRQPMTPTEFAYSVTFSPGEAYAVWLGRSRGVRLVEYRDGAWVMLDEIAIPPVQIGTISAAWISRDADDRVFVVFASPAAATFYRQGDGVTSYPIATASDAPPGRLIEVWGAGPDKFWVLDERGSIWERSDGRWRQIVRAPEEEGFRLRDAWVSADGVVFAVTHDAVHRLGG